VCPVLTSASNLSLYENYRRLRLLVLAVFSELTQIFRFTGTEKLSRSVVGGSAASGGLNESYGAGSPGPDGREGSVLPEDLATQSVRLKEEQLRREGESTCDAQ